MSEEEELSIKGIVGCLKHDLEILENKEKYPDISAKDLRECLANITATLVFLFEGLGAKEEVMDKIKSNANHMFA